jgi:hypothetical protein
VLTKQVYDKDTLCHDVGYDVHLCMILSPPCEKISCVLGPYGMEKGGGGVGWGSKDTHMRWEAATVQT